MQCYSPPGNRLLLGVDYIMPAPSLGALAARSVLVSKPEVAYGSVLPQKSRATLRLHCVTSEVAYRCVRGGGALHDELRWCLWGALVVAVFDDPPLASVVLFSVPIASPTIRGSPSTGVELYHGFKRALCPRVSLELYQFLDEGALGRKQPFSYKKGAKM